MSRYNTKKAPEVVKSHEGGVVYKLKDEMALFSLLSTGIDKSFYEGSDAREQRLVDLINTLAKKDPLLVAKMLVYARQKMGQRTVTHRGAVALAPFVKGSKWGSKFFSKRHKTENKGGIVYRLDDMTEIISCYFFENPDPTSKRGHKPLANAMRRGFKSVIEHADPYELAKYQVRNKDLSLIDVVNMVRPVPQEHNKEALAALMKDELAQFDTVEDKNTSTGQKVAEKVRKGEITKDEAAEELKESKTANFAQLIEERKIGYMALLRNLRNILKASDSLIKSAGELLTDEKMIVKSLVFPHQIDLALEVVMSEFQTTAGRKLLPYINKAYEISVQNVKELGIDEHTAVIIDTSGSMFSNWSSLNINGNRLSNRQPAEKASLIGATLAKGVNADLYQFSDYTKEIEYNPLDSVNTIKNTVLRQQGVVGHGTQFDSIFKKIENKYYKRLFIITDGQSSDSTITRGSAYQAYVRKYGQPYIYYIDLCGYGSTPVNTNNQSIHFLSGYSAAIYETAKNYEIDPEALMNEIRAIEF